MKNVILRVVVLVLFVNTCTFAQKLPEEMYISDDGRMLFTGGKATKGFYNESKIRHLYLNFTQPNYWTLLTNNYKNKINLPASLTYDGTTYDSVGVRFKGMTSYSMSGNSQKKSFNISLDYVNPDQNIGGYNTLNLNNSFQDPSFFREVFYLHQIRNHTPAAKANFVQLFINGEHWGLYPNVQQLNKDFLKEWFFSNDGTNWRADAPAGSSGGGGGPGWGDGTAALNYLGDDTTQYKKYYTLKSTGKPQPWKDLVETCKILNTTSAANLENALADYLDIDRALWFLASEIIYTDDDGYAYKGKMDYYIYRDEETGRITPYDYDGNSAMETAAVNWSPFYNETKVNYPLLNKLLAVPNIRQRYLAHMRTLIQEGLDTSKVNPVLNNYVAMVDTIVQNDTKKTTTYAAFKNEVQVLKNFILNRKNYLLSNTEVNKVGPTITETKFFVNNIEGKKPNADEEVIVTTKLSNANGIDHASLYFSTGIYGKFSKSSMYDDGLHNDGAANDGTFGGILPGNPAGTWVRYYIEAVAGNTAKTAAYDPVGAEHDVYVYQVNYNQGSTDVVINELMASNLTGPQDEAGEFEDWIELYNKSEASIDLSGYHLSDNITNFKKFKIPSNTVIEGKSYLIIWADEKQSQGDLHANFKLSADGEWLGFSDANGTILDSVSFPKQTDDLSFSRIPNGTGTFVIKNHTFGKNNETTATSNILSKGNAITLQPNPADKFLMIKNNTNQAQFIRIKNINGQTVSATWLISSLQIDTHEFPSGLYIVQTGNEISKIVIMH